MYIVMITGSPHKNGTSALLADEFIKGAEESGHSVFRFNTAFECVSPLYYHCLSAQIKIAIDRFHGIDNALIGTNKKAMLLMTAASNVESIYNGALGSYHETVKYLGWNDSGVLLAYGCSTRADIEKTDYPKKAYELGRAVK